MHPTTTLTAALVVFSGIASGADVTATTPDGQILLEGEPRFLIGLYAFIDDDAALREAAEAGFNLFQSKPDREYLDRVAAAGAHAWINLGANLNLSGPEAEAHAVQLATFIDGLKDHPALALWEGPDEALWNAWYNTIEYNWAGTEYETMRTAAAALSPEDQQLVSDDIERMQAFARRSLWVEADAVREAIWKRIGQPIPRPDLTFSGMAEKARVLGDGLTTGIRLVKEHDSGRIVWLNHAPRNAVVSMRHHNEAADMAGCDIYPVPPELPQNHSDLPDTTLASVGAYTRRMADAAPGKAVAMVLQGFGWADINDGIKERAQRSGEPFGRRPTYAESRFMAYDAIVNGASAILYWGTAYIERESRLWQDLLDLARELDALQPALSAPTEPSPPVALADEGYGSVDADALRLLCKRAGDDYVLIIVNEAVASTAFSVTGLPAALEGRELYRLGSDETHTIHEGAFRDGIAGMEAYVYATSRRFEPEARQEATLPASLPDPIRMVLDVTAPLDHPRGSRLPLYLWPAMNAPVMTDAEARALVSALDQRGIGLVCTWDHNQIEDSLAAALPIARAQVYVGQPIAINATPLLYAFFDGTPETAHIDADGNTFWDSSFGKPDMGCPFALEHRVAPMRDRFTPFIEQYRKEGLPVGFVFADWEIDGPIEWNGAWEASKRCARCREQVTAIDTDFMGFQKALRGVRSHLQREAYAHPLITAFPEVLVGNYAVYPHDGHRYWYDYFEQYAPGQPETLDQQARYRAWASEFAEAGYTFAMPVVYPWSWTYQWYDFDVPDYRWFYNMLKTGSNPAQHTAAETPLITFVHWHTVEVGAEVGSGPRETTPEGEQISEHAYQELLWHLLLRGHDTFFLWCQAQEYEQEVRLLHPVWREAQQYGAFLDRGVPVTFDTPSRPGTVVSGLRLGNRVLVRRTDFTGNTDPVQLPIGDQVLDIPAGAAGCLELELPQ